MRVVKRIKLKGRVRFTRHLGGKTVELPGRWLDVLEINGEGECLSVLNQGEESTLINVDPRDIEEEAPVPSNSFFKFDVVKKVEKFIGRRLGS